VNINYIFTAPLTLDDPDPYKQVVDFSRKRLHRVFLDRRHKLDRGGRFYGAWYQNIPKEYRQHIMIDGAPTMELDYSALHPNLLYYHAGVDPPKGGISLWVKSTFDL
jgi:hypothetical protein